MYIFFLKSKVKCSWLGRMKQVVTYSSFSTFPTRWYFKLPSRWGKKKTKHEDSLLEKDSDC